MTADPQKRDNSRYCRYHKDQSHDTNDCRQLKDEIKFLSWRGQLQRYVGQREGGANTGNGRNDNRTNPPAQARGGVINTISRGLVAGGDTNSTKKAYAREILHAELPNKKAKIE